MKKLALGVAAVALLVCGTFASAEPLLGRGTWVGRVEAYSSRYINETFVGGRLAVVSIVGDGSTDVDVFVYDAAGRLVVRGIGLTDRERVSFYPPATGRYTIELRNLGSVWNRVLLMTD